MIMGATKVRRSLCAVSRRCTPYRLELSRAMWQESCRRRDSYWPRRASRSGARGALLKRGESYATCCPHRYTARAGPGAIAELCVATTWRWRASRARGGRGMTWADGWARNSVSGRVMPAPMCSSPGSARDEDKCAGRCWGASVAYLGPRSEGPRLHVVRN